MIAKILPLTMLMIFTFMIVCFCNQIELLRKFVAVGIDLTHNAWP